MKDPRLTPLASGEPDEVDLELRLLGAVGDRDVEERIAEAAAGDLATADAELRAFREHWARADRPPLPSPPQAANRPWPVLALAAAALLSVVGLWTWTPGTPTSPDTELRAMGTLPVDVAVERNGRQLEVPVPFEAGDRLRLGMMAPRAGELVVAAVHEDGTVTVLWEGPVAQGRRFRLDGAVELDDGTGREWLVVRLSEEDRPALDRLLPEPKTHVSEDTWVLEITRRP